MRRVNILGVEISAVNKETAIQYLLENMDKARGKYICACNCLLYTSDAADD